MYTYKLRTIGVARPWGCTWTVQRRESTAKHCLSLLSLRHVSVWSSVALFFRLGIMPNTLHAQALPLPYLLRQACIQKIPRLLDRDGNPDPPCLHGRQKVAAWQRLGANHETLCPHPSEECTVYISTYQYKPVHTCTYEYVLVRTSTWVSMAALLCGRHDLVQGSTSSAVPYHEMSWYSTDWQIPTCTDIRQVYRILREMACTDLYWSTY